MVHLNHVMTYRQMSYGSPIYHKNLGNKVNKSYLSIPSSIFFLKKLFFPPGEGGTDAPWLPAIEAGVEQSPSELLLQPGDTFISTLAGCWGGAIVTPGGVSWPLSLADVGCPVTRKKKGKKKKKRNTQIIRACGIGTSML